jgi:hypothetical protein
VYSRDSQSRKRKVHVCLGQRSMIVDSPIDPQDRNRSCIPHAAVVCIGRINRRLSVDYNFISAIQCLRLHRLMRSWMYGMRLLIAVPTCRSPHHLIAHLSRYKNLIFINIGRSTIAHRIVMSLLHDMQHPETWRINGQPRSSAATFEDKINLVSLVPPWSIFFSHDYI